MHALLASLSHPCDANRNQAPYQMAQPSRKFWPQVSEPSDPRTIVPVHSTIQPFTSSFLRQPNPMALNATIYKVELQVADMDRHYYGNHALTIARHPSETVERMLARLIAFALHADENLAFTKGLSEADEPDVWLKDLTGAIDQWIEIGQPTETRVLKACGRAKQVIVYCFNGQASKLWWDGVKHKTERAKNLKVVCLPQEGIRQLAQSVERHMTFQVTRQDGEIFVPLEDRQVSLQPEVWRDVKS